MLVLAKMYLRGGNKIPPYAISYCHPPEKKTPLFLVYHRLGNESRLSLTVFKNRFPGKENQLQTPLPYIVTVTTVTKTCKCAWKSINELKSKCPKTL